MGIKPFTLKWGSRPEVQGGFLFAFAFLILAWLAFATPAFFGTDDYYHAGAAVQIIQQGRLALHFPWLPMTLLNPQAFVDHHLLFHMYVAPWAYLGGIPGAKLATISIAAMAVVAAWMLLRQIGVRYSILWAFGFFALSTPFLYRILMVRTQGAALLLLIITLSLLFQRRYRWLILSAFAYTWLYNGFILLLGVAVIYVIGQWMSDGHFEWQPVGFVAAGIILGLIINPYFPQNILFAVHHLGAKVRFEDGVEVGREWYPYTTGALLENSLGALVALAAGLLRPSVGGGRRDRAETVLLLMALLTLFMLFKSRRFIEYFPAFALLFCAASWGRGKIRLTLPRQILMLRRAVPLVAVIIAVGLGWQTLNAAYQDANDARSVDYLAGASTWLREHTPEDTIIFQTDWDDFTRLFYFNSQNNYLVGLDPTYLELSDPELWDQWVAITRGQVERPSTVIQTVFHSNYVVSDANHDDFIQQANDDPAMQLVYQDDDSYVWQIKPATIKVSIDTREQ